MRIKLNFFVSSPFWHVRGESKLGHAHEHELFQMLLHIQLLMQAMI